MIYISLQKYNMEFAPKGEKLKLFYNPNDTVAIFEAGDEDLWGYVFEKGVSLKESGFSMNPGNASSIREYLSANALEKEKLSPVEKGAESTKPITPLISKKQHDKLVSELDSKPSVAKLTAIIKELLGLIQSSRQ